MKPLKVGALFAGYGGIEVALASVLDVEPAWFAEFEDAPSRILAHRFPDVPNLGDVTKVDWSAVEPVDIITGGSPCQDLSHAGKRAGMKAGTRSGLWASMCDAVDIIRPRLVVWENVRGALSAEADSELEHCTGCMGDPRQSGASLRALGRVLGDLADIGYDARWYGLRAADVGAAHGRFRVFLFAQPSDADVSGLKGLRGAARAAPTGRHRHAESGPGRPDLTLLPTPVADNSRGLPSSGTDYASLANVAVSLLPTPSVADGMGGHLSRSGDRSHELLLPGVAKKLGEDMALLPTPRATDGTKGGPNNENRQSEGYGGGRGNYHGLVNGTVSWGDYAPAIARWETVLGRPAPAPTEPGAKGGHRLAPRFVEFLMGLPEGWVCDVPGLTRNNQLKALGNGVVPQQCAAAFRAYLTDTAREAIP